MRLNRLVRFIYFIRVTSFKQCCPLECNYVNNKDPFKIDPSRNRINNIWRKNLNEKGDTSMVSQDVDNTFLCSNENIGLKGWGVTGSDDTRLMRDVVQYLRQRSRHTHTNTHRHTYYTFVKPISAIRVHTIVMKSGPPNFSVRFHKGLYNKQLSILTLL